MRSAARREQGPGPDGESTIVLVGGCGGLSARYREVARERGLTLRHFERRVPPGARHTLGRVAVVVVMAGMVSHALRDQVRNLLTDDAPIVYLRTSSISALRSAVEQLAA